MKPRLLDLFCGAGGCSVGYNSAGFEVTGIDQFAQRHYPFEFIQGDALDLSSEWLSRFDVIHASPPCQCFSMANYKARIEGTSKSPDLIDKTRKMLISSGRPWVIENVPPAPLIKPIILCGTMFGLGVFRHRKFESNVGIVPPAHEKHAGRIGDGKYFSVAGGAGRWKSWGRVERNVTKGTIADWKNAMGIDWMVGKEITQAIPPAYTEWIGRQLIGVLQ